MSLKGKVKSPIAPENTEPGTVIPIPISRRSSSPNAFRSVEKNRTTSVSPRSSPILPQIKPERKLSEEDTRHNHHNAGWTFSAPLPGGRALRVVFPKSVVVRTAKSAILAAKVILRGYEVVRNLSTLHLLQVLSIPSPCPSDGKLYTLTTSSLILLAISDTWFENWNATFGLSLLHLALLRFGYNSCLSL